MKRIGKVIVLIIIMLSISKILFAASDSIVLKNEHITVFVKPETLQVMVNPENKDPFIISSGQENIGPVEIRKSGQDDLVLYLSESVITVKIHLNNQDLSVSFTAEGEESITWPIINQSQNLKALILPHWEGVYAPVNNPRWRNYLSERSWNTLEGLTMPFIGLDLKDYNLTYIFPNRYDNDVEFKENGDIFETSVVHSFTEKNGLKEYEVLIKFSQDYSPVEPAKQFRKWLIDHGEFVTMKEKIKQVPKAEWLLGAPHAYLWGIIGMTHDDVKKGQWISFCKKIVNEASGKGQPKTPGGRIKELIEPKYWDEIEKLSNLEYTFPYNESVITEGLNTVLRKNDFYQKEYFNANIFSKELTGLLKLESSRALTPAETFKKNALLMHDAYGGTFVNFKNWGYGYSVNMLKMIKDAGIDRMKFSHDI